VSPDAAATSPLRRACCPACARPRTTCLCTLAVAPPIANLVPVLLLQHPREVAEAKGSARLLDLSLARCHRVVFDDAFAPAALAALLGAGGRRSLLLYPAVDGDADAGAAPAEWPGASEATPAALARLQLVVVDATWRKSLKILHTHPALRALPRLALAGPLPPSAYVPLRRARRPGQLSTLEATALALGRLEAAPARYAGLLAAFVAFVAREAARRPPRRESAHGPR